LVYKYLVCPQLFQLQKTDSVLIVSICEPAGLF